MSRRVGDTLGSMVPTIKNYSIDESFLNLGEFREREVEPLARELRDRVHRWVGIPTCVGSASTKTLAKVANFIAKKRPQYRGVCDLRSSQMRAELLPTVPVGEVWGIGGASAAKLAKLGVQTAADLAALEPDDARALMTVTGGRTVYGLRGVSCLSLELMEPTRKGIAVTRSFGVSVTAWLEMREAIASYAARAAEKMRRYKVAAENIFVFMHTNTFNNDPFYSNGASARFSDTTNDTGEVVALAVRLGERLWRDGHPFGQGFDLRLVPEKLGEPLRWSEPKMIFVNSMSDLFHPDVPDAFIMQVAETMQLARWHTYQVLTKRPERLRRMLNGPLREAATQNHIWWGVSVEDRKYGVPRIADLQATPATIRFLSVEPLLEDLGILPLDGISWVIVGGESGPGARPMEEAWVVSVQKQCKAAGVPFFFKQWGGVRKKVYGRTLRGRTHDGFPKRVKHPILPAIVRLQHALEIEGLALIQITTA